jgi:hypothetical protein
MLGSSKHQPRYDRGQSGQVEHPIFAKSSSEEMRMESKGRTKWQQAAETYDVDVDEAVPIVLLLSILVVEAKDCRFLNVDNADEAVGVVVDENVRARAEVGVECNNLAFDTKRVVGSTEDFALDIVRSGIMIVCDSI